MTVRTWFQGLFQDRVEISHKAILAHMKYMAQALFARDIG
jgi:hypothetical protein